MVIKAEERDPITRGETERRGKVRPTIIIADRNDQQFSWEVIPVEPSQRDEFDLQ